MTRGGRVRAVGLEPTRSFEHGHLKPACLPVSPRPQRADRTASRRSRICRRRFHTLEASRAKGARRCGRLSSSTKCRRLIAAGRERLRNCTPDWRTPTDGAGLAAPTSAPAPKPARLTVRRRHDFRTLPRRRTATCWVCISATAASHEAGESGAFGSRSTRSTRRSSTAAAKQSTC